MGRATLDGPPLSTQIVFLEHRNAELESALSEILIEALVYDGVPEIDKIANIAKAALLYLPNHRGRINELLKHNQATEP